MTDIQGLAELVRGRADEQHVSAIEHEAEESHGDARPAASRAEVYRRQSPALQAHVRRASHAQHAAELATYWACVCDVPGRYVRQLMTRCRVHGATHSTCDVIVTVRYVFVS